MRTTSVVAVFLLLTICAACGGERDSKALLYLQSRSEFNFDMVADDERAFAGAGRIEYSPDAPSNATFKLSLGANVELDTKVLRNGSEMPIVIRTVLPGDTLILEMYLTGGAASGKFEVEFANPQGDHLATYCFSATGAKPDPVPDASLSVSDSPIPAIESVDAFTGVPGMGGGGTGLDSLAATLALSQLAGREIVIHLTGPGGTIFVDPDTGETVSEALFDPSGVWNAARFGLMTDNLSEPAAQRYKFYIAGNGGHTITSYNLGFWGLNTLRMGTTTDIARSDGSGAGDPPPQTFTVVSPGNNIIWLTTPTGTTQPLIGYNIPAGQRVISAYYDSLTGILYVVTEQPANGRAGKIYAIDTMNPTGSAFPPGLVTGEGPVKIDYADGIVACANQQANTIGIYQKDSSAEGLSHVTDLPAGGPVYGVDARAHGDSVEVIWGTNGFLHFARVSTLDGTVTAEATIAVAGMPGLQYARWFVGGGALFSSLTHYGFTYNAQEAFDLDPAYAD